MKLTNPPDYRRDTVLPLPLDVKASAWAVDAACSGNPGQMEYQGIDLATGEQVFHFGPVFGTNNIGEFLAIVHALALMEQRGITDKIIYSDSFTAMTWVHKKHCKTKLEHTPETEKLYEVIRRAEQWLRVHPVRVPIIQWETKLWGEIPADFGRKNNYLKGR
ncbi:MAG: ribonuclease H [Prevotella sp.]|nr:ribonuclease H [Prevotella sp.]